mmetsp:Transcript_47668/g.91004  ORF Transcript_47668/g.91004 Transcript_47668/m.91004 type:complete len:315 (+) Transcript_47668:824-1768(+)
MGGLRWWGDRSNASSYDARCWGPPCCWPLKFWYRLSMEGLFRWTSLVLRVWAVIGGRVGLVPRLSRGEDGEEEGLECDLDPTCMASPTSPQRSNSWSLPVRTIWKWGSPLGGTIPSAPPPRAAAPSHTGAPGKLTTGIGGTSPMPGSICMPLEGASWGWACGWDPPLPPPPGPKTWMPGPGPGPWVGAGAGTRAGECADCAANTHWVDDCARGGVSPKGSMAWAWATSNAGDEASTSLYVGTGHGAARAPGSAKGLPSSSRDAELSGDMLELVGRGGPATILEAWGFMLVRRGGCCRKGRNGESTLDLISLITV